MAWTKVVSVKKGSTGGAGAGFTTSAINTTTSGGADLIVACVVWYSGGGNTANLSDSASNTWHGLTVQTTNTPIKARLFYATKFDAGFATSTNHTFTIAGTPSDSTFAGLTVVAFNGSLTTASPLDTQNGAVNNSTASIQPGAAGANGDLAVTGLGNENTSAKSLNLSYTVEQDLSWVNGVSEGSSIGWEAQTGADNPTWSWTGTTDAAAVMGTFKPAGGAATPPLFRTGLPLNALNVGGPFFGNPIG